MGLLLTLIAVTGFSGCVVDAPLEQVVEASERDLIALPHGPVHLNVTAPEAPRSDRANVWRLGVEHRGAQGDDAFPYSGECGSPWAAHLYTANGDALQVRAPTVQCEALGIRHLEPGNTLSTTWQWNLTFWDTASDSYRRLGFGDHRIEFFFIRMETDGRVDLERSPRVDYRITVVPINDRS